MNKDKKRKDRRLVFELLDGSLDVAFLVVLFVEILFEERRVLPELGRLVIERAGDVRVG